MWQDVYKSLQQGSFLLGKKLRKMSSAKRWDNRNRILYRGESQRKDGRYVYKYVDARNVSYSVIYLTVSTQSEAR